MKIVVGTTNKGKLGAVLEVMSDYNMYRHADIESKQVDSGVAEQPIGLKEIIKGAKQRAKLSQESGELGIGIESGLMEFDETPNDYLELCVCAIYDGGNYSLGTSCGFVCPPDIIKKIKEDNLTLLDAVIATGHSNDPDLGEKQGIIGNLTDNRITRIDYTKQAVIMALIPFTYGI